MSSGKASFDEALKRAGSPAELARRLGLSEPQIGRVRDRKSGISVETALALADYLDAPDPLPILEEYGHKRSVQYLRRFFGSPGRDKLTRSQRDLHDDIDAIPRAEWRHLRAVIRAAAAAARALTRRATRTPGKN